MSHHRTLFLAAVKRLRANRIYKSCIKAGHTKIACNIAEAYRLKEWK